MLLRFYGQAYEKKTTPKWRYNLGRKKNFEQVGIVSNILVHFFLSFFNFDLKLSVT